MVRQVGGKPGGPRCLQDLDATCDTVDALRCTNQTDNTQIFAFEMRVWAVVVAYQDGAPRFELREKRLELASELRKNCREVRDKHRRPLAP